MSTPDSLAMNDGTGDPSLLGSVLAAVARVRTADAALIDARAKDSDAYARFVSLRMHATTHGGVSPEAVGELCDASRATDATLQAANAEVAEAERALLAAARTSR